MHPQSARADVVSFWFGDAQSGRLTEPVGYGYAFAQAGRCYVMAPWHMFQSLRATKGPMWLLDVTVRFAGDASGAAYGLTQEEAPKPDPYGFASEPGEADRAKAQTEAGLFLLDGAPRQCDSVFPNVNTDAYAAIMTSAGQKNAFFSIPPGTGAPALRARLVRKETTNPYTLMRTEVAQVLLKEGDSGSPVFLDGRLVGLVFGQKSVRDRRQDVEIVPLTAWIQQFDISLGAPSPFADAGRTPAPVVPFGATSDLIPTPCDHFGTHPLDPKRLKGVEPRDWSTLTEDFAQRAIAICNADIAAAGSSLRHKYIIARMSHWLLKGAENPQADPPFALHAELNALLRSGYWIALANAYSVLEDYPKLCHSDDIHVCHRQLADLAQGARADYPEWHLSMLARYGNVETGRASFCAPNETPDDCPHHFAAALAQWQSAQPADQAWMRYNYARLLDRAVPAWECDTPDDCRVRAVTHYAALAPERETRALVELAKFAVDDPELYRLGVPRTACTAGPCLDEAFAALDTAADAGSVEALFQRGRITWNHRTALNCDAACAKSAVADLQAALEGGAPNAAGYLYRFYDRGDSLGLCEDRNICDLKAVNYLYEKGFDQTDWGKRVMAESIYYDKPGVPCEGRYACLVYAQSLIEPQAEAGHGWSQTQLAQIIYEQFDHLDPEDPETDCRDTALDRLNLAVDMQVSAIAQGNTWRSEDWFYKIGTALGNLYECQTDQKPLRPGDDKSYTLADAEDPDWDNAPELVRAFASSLGPKLAKAVDREGSFEDQDIVIATLKILNKEMLEITCPDEVPLCARMYERARSSLDFSALEDDQVYRLLDRDYGDAPNDILKEALSYLTETEAALTDAAVVGAIIGKSQIQACMTENRDFPTSDCRLLPWSFGALLDRMDLSDEALEDFFGRYGFSDDMLEIGRARGSQEASDQLLLRADAKALSVSARPDYARQMLALMDRTTEQIALYQFFRKASDLAYSEKGPDAVFLRAAAYDLWRQSSCMKDACAFDWLRSDPPEVIAEVQKRLQKEAPELVADGALGPATMRAFGNPPCREQPEDAQLDCAAQKQTDLAREILTMVAD